jgi:histone-lysine N-methyltransferase SETMAR
LDSDALKAELESNSQQTTRGSASSLSCHYSTVSRGLDELGLVNMLGRYVPHDLTQANKDRRVDCATELLTKRRTHAWLDHLITGDESWVLYDTPKRKHHWLRSGSKPPVQPKGSLHPKKLLLCIWWSERGVEYWELLPENSTVTARIYTTQLANLKAKLDSDPYWAGHVFFQHDNARPHVANVTRSTLQGYGWEVICHPPYSPDLAPSDYHLFRSLKNHLAGRSFTNRQAMETGLADFFASKPKSFYREGIHDLPRRWTKVICNYGEYVVD